MSGEGNDFATLAARFRRLGAADRRTVLARFSPSERQAFERRLAAEAEEQRRRLMEERRADRQFARYSQGLAQKVERAIRDKPGEESELTKACAMAVARAHRAAETPAEQTPLTLLLHKLGFGAADAENGARS